MSSEESQHPFTSPLSQNLEIREFDQAGNLVTTYAHHSSSPGRRETGDKRRETLDTTVPGNVNGYAKSFLNAFLPVGYPNSVTSDYLEYQIYDSLQAFSSSIAGMLSSRAVLEGIGVGDSHASPTAALLLSVLQESMGRIATILFAHRLGTALEPECKMYRLAADVFNDAAMLLDCLSPALPKLYRVMLLSLSSVLRALCGVAAGSSKASLSAHFATQGNLGELNAKDSSQETIISLLGMLAGSVVVSVITSKIATWTAMILLLAVHLGMNYMAVKAVCMRTLNRQRANIVLSEALEDSYFESPEYDEVQQGKSVSKLKTSQLLGPEEVYLQERVFERDGVLRWRGGEVLGYCRLGVKLQDILHAMRSQGQQTEHPVAAPVAPVDLRALLDAYKSSDYILWYDVRRETALVCFKTISPSTCLRAWLQALLMATSWRVSRIESNFDALKRTRLFVEENWSMTEEKLRDKGWGIDVDALLTRESTCIQVTDSVESGDEAKKDK